MTGEKKTTPPFAMLGEFDSVGAVLTAARSIRDVGFQRWDVHSPFPIHGIDAAMGIRPTRLPWLVLGGGMVGLVAGLVLAWWTNVVDYPFLVSGKPLFSLPANVPVIFETTVLLAAFAAVFGMLLLNGLPMLYSPLFKSRRYRKATDDRLIIVIEADDRRFDPHRTRELLESLGAVQVEVVEED